MWTWRYFLWRPSIDRCIVAARRTSRDCQFARVNWSAHVKPIVTERVAAFASTLKSKGCNEPYCQVLGDFVNPFDPPDNEEFLNSITINFGSRPLPLRTVVKVPSRLRVVAERQAGLVFSQLASGGVVIAIYPPTSELAKPDPEYYLGAILSDPLELTQSLVDSLLVQLFRIDCACSAITLRRGSGARIMRRLKWQDQRVRHGPLWKKFGKAILATIKAIQSLAAAAHGAPVPPA
jgi:hypothetical protein